MGENLKPAIVGKKPERYKSDRAKMSLINLKVIEEKCDSVRDLYMSLE